MADKDEQLKKMMNLLADSKERRIHDYISGLLFEEFQNITGTPREVYMKYSSMLRRRYTFLKWQNRKNTDKECEKLLGEIKIFLLKNKKLPTISSDVDDYKERGRIVTIRRSDDEDYKNSCVPETLKDNMNFIREEQYADLISQVEYYVGEATSYIKSKFPWINDAKYTLEIKGIGQIQIGGDEQKDA